MTGLFKAITSKDTITENGMATHSTSSNSVMDLFFKMGGWGNKINDSEVLDIFIRAYRQNRLLATKALFYNRDIRGGQGRRNTFRLLFGWLCKNDPEVAIANLQNVPYFGRWDDIFVAMNTPVESAMYDIILSALKSGDKLCAKWMPRENKANGKTAKWLMTAFGLTPRSYRKLLSGNTSVVENIMCNREWSQIDYNHVPSVAVGKYRKAFYRNDLDRFTKWIASLEKGEAGVKINAGAVYPHDIVTKMSRVDGATNKMLEAQWKALPNYMPEGRKILPVCDVSGSMGGTPMDVCISLGLYLSERNNGPFKDGFITFSTTPKLEILSGTLYERIRQLRTAHWDMSTNLEAVFRLILSKAIAGRVAEEDMPTDILILSDMQFNACVGGLTAMEMIRVMYTQAGYTMPNVIFWNLRTSSGIPAKYDESGVALVSGFSPSVMTGLLSGEINPIRVMLNILESDRYSRVN